MENDTGLKTFIICFTIILVFIAFSICVQCFAGDGTYRVDKSGCVHWSARQNDLSIKKEKERLISR